MPKLAAVSALAGARRSADGAILETSGLRVVEHPVATLSLRAPRRFLDAAVKLSSVAGVVLPASPNLSVETGSIRAAWMEPNVWLLFGPRDAIDGVAEKLERSELRDQCLISDLTSGRATIELSGRHAANIISTGCPLDLHPRTFAIGQSARSLFHEIDILLVKSGDDRYAVMCDSSLATTFVAMLVDAAEVAGLASATTAHS